MFLMSNMMNVSKAIKKLPAANNNASSLPIKYHPLTRDCDTSSP
ncbi:exported hypothetical protein [Clostridium neonatale]|nr:exported hypothetical protein [Clostridium neonatale]